MVLTPLHAFCDRYRLLSIDYLRNEDDTWTLFVMFSPSDGSEWDTLPMSIERDYETYLDVVEAADEIERMSD